MIAQLLSAKASKEQKIKGAKMIRLMILPEKLLSFI